MNQILLNMANRLLLDFCRDSQIDCSGTRCVKDGRGFAFVLRQENPADARWPDIARITFHKNQHPTFGWQ